MNLKLANDKDVAALQTVTGCHTGVISTLLATYASEQSDEEDFTAHINRMLVTASYRSNPSVLALTTMNKTQGFADCSGYQTPNADEYITIVLHRCKKPDHARKSTPKASAKQVIKGWLALNLPRLETLDIPIESIPKFLLTHSEQLTYQIHRETNVRITIKKFKTKWQIQRK